MEKGAPATAGAPFSLSQTLVGLLCYFSCIVVTVPLGFVPYLSNQLRR